MSAVLLAIKLIFFIPVQGQMQISEHSTGSAICRYRLQLSLNEPEGGHCFHWGAEEVLVGDEII